MNRTSRCQPPVNRRWIRLWAVVTLAAVVVAGCSSPTNPASGSPGPATSTPTTVAQAAARRIEAAIGDIPWSQVGPGWMLAMWSPAVGTRPGASPPPGTPTFETATTTLYLVDPAGNRYAITTFPPPGDGSTPELVGWSGDGSHALFQIQGRGPTTVVEVDLHTGTQTTVALDGSPRFTRPAGKAILLSTGGVPALYPNRGASPRVLKRVDLAGNPQLTYPTDKLGSPFNGEYLSTPDGTRLVLGTASGLVMMGNDGTVGSTLSIPGQSDCMPMRWWDGTVGATVLAKCDSSANAARLWLIPIDGSTPTALSAPNNGQKGPDYGDANAWQLPAGTFVQALGACGVIYLAKLNTDGTTTPVSVPGVANGTIVVVGVNGSHLDLHAKLACGSGQSLVDYDPAANTTTVLLGGPVNGGGVIAAVPYPGQE
jgi:TolB protein